MALGGDGTGDNGERVAELAAALRQLMDPALRERLKAAMTSPLQEPGSAAWTNGSTTGAGAILKLLMPPAA